MNYLSPKFKSQSGVYTVEFAFSIAICMFLLFGIIETGRLLYTWSALNLVTQRGARVAAVCPINDEKIAQIAIFANSSTGSSKIIPGVGPENISVSYFDKSGATSTAYEDVVFVNVAITGYTHNLLIPILQSDDMERSILAPSFSTTLPVESLGYDPTSGSRVCFT